MSNKISFECSNCSKALSVDAKHAGRKGKCKGCGTTLEVPFPQKSEALPAIVSAPVIDSVPASVPDAPAPVPADSLMPSNSGPEIITREHVIQAIESYSEELNHGFGNPTKYELNFEGNKYPPKAIVGIAFRFAAGRILSPSEFSGGNQKGQANYILRELGFDVESIVETVGEKPKDLVHEDNGDEKAASDDSESEIFEQNQNVQKSGDIQIPKDFDDLSLEAKLDFFRELYSREDFSQWKLFPVGSLAVENDSHLPQVFLDMLIGDFLELPARRIRNKPGVGEGRITKLCSLLLRVADKQWVQGVVADAGSVAAAGFKSLNVDKKIEYLKRFYSNEAYSHLIGLPIQALTVESDRHLPRVFLSQKIGAFLNLPASKIFSEPGVGEGKIHKLCDVLLRGIDSSTGKEQPIPNANSGSIERTTATSFSALPINSVPLAQLVDSLKSVSANTWHLDVPDLLEMETSEISDVQGIGPSKSEAIIQQLSKIKQQLGSIRDKDREFCLTLTRVELQKIENWFFDVLASSEPPSLLEFRLNVVEPILDLVERDFDFEMRQILQGRLGLEEPPKTLLELGDAYGVTRERIRQKLMKAAYAIQIRLPRGKVLFSLLASRTARGVQHAKLNSLLRDCDFLFSSEEKTEQPGRPSASDILSAWAAQGQEHHTPFSHAELIQWISDSFPGVVDNFAFDLIASDALVAKSPNGNTIFLTNRIEDRAYAYLLNSADRVTLEELAEVLEANDRNLNIAIAADQRMAMDDDHNVVLLEDIGFRRHDGKWFLNLNPIQDSPDLDNEVIIPVETLIKCVLNGMSSNGVVDATVWGVFRYVSELLEYEYRSGFPLGVNEIILADVLVSHSRGKIRNMRRRRLRWDSEDAPSAIGKKGWISKVVNQACAAITIDELDEGLRENYQDYADYVLDQLSSTDDEDGDESAAFEVLKILRSSLPMIVSPSNSRVTDEADSVSLLVASLLSALTETEIQEVTHVGNLWVNAFLNREAIVSNAKPALKDTDHIPQPYVPLANAVAEILSRNGEPMRISEIRRELLAEGVPIPGQGKDANIIIYLRQSSDFCRTALGTYALVSWGLPTIDKPKTCWNKSTQLPSVERNSLLVDDKDYSPLDETGDRELNGSQMKIYEAAHRVLQETGQPTHVTEIYNLISTKGYYQFNSKNPLTTLGVSIDSHASNVGISRSVEPILFYRHAPAMYGLIEWNQTRPDEKTPLSLPSNIDEPQAYVSGTKPEIWFALSHWAKVNDQLESRERGLAYSIGRVLSGGNNPSPKQAKWAVDILERAKQAGFDPADAKPKEKTKSQPEQKSDSRTDNVNDVLASFILGE